METNWYSNLSGDDWEEMCNSLLPIKHGASYQPITDKGGDWGIDGLVISEGIAYQAYGQEADNKDPQKGFTQKISGDLNKLKKYKEDIQAILGEAKIQKWVLLFNKQIPHSDIHKYQTKKQNEVIGWGLPHIASNFEVFCQPPSYLKTEYFEYDKRKDGSIDIPFSTSSLEAIDNLKNNDKYKMVHKKFLVIADSEDTAHKLAYDEAVNYFDYSSQLEDIRKAEPDFYSAIEDIRSDVEKEAEQGSLLQGDFSSWSNTRRTLEYRLDKSIAGKLSQATKQRVRNYIISEWFVRCPLRFKKKTEGRLYDYPT